MNCILRKNIAVPSVNLSKAELTNSVLYLNGGLVNIVPDHFLSVLRKSMTSSHAPFLSTISDEYTE